MPRSKNYLWLEASWYTKNKKPLIKKHFKQVLLRCCKNEFMSSDCKVKTILVRSTKVSVTFKPNLAVSLAATIQQVKGTSSFYINNQRFLKIKFEWEKGYSIANARPNPLKRKTSAPLEAEAFTN